MKNILIILFLFVSVYGFSQNAYTKRNELKTVTRNNVYTVYTYDELGNMKTKNVSVISGSEEIVNEFVTIQHIIANEEVDVAISDGVDGKLIQVYNEKNKLVWEYLIENSKNSSNLKSITLNSVVMDVSEFLPGYYFVNVFDSIGVQLARKQIEIEEGSQTSVEEIDLLGSEIIIFPNPAKEKITIQFGDGIDNISAIKIIDLSSGKPILNKTVSEFKTQIIIPLNDFMSGIYLLLIYQGESVIKQEEIIVTK